MNVTCGSQNFLCNTSNNEQLIKLLSTFLRTNCFNVVQCNGGANTSIAEKTIEYANADKQIAVAADDTDVPVLLMHSGLADIIFTTEKMGKRIVLQKS